MTSTSTPTRTRCTPVSGRRRRSTTTSRTTSGRCPGTPMWRRACSTGRPSPAPAATSSTSSAPGSSCPPASCCSRTPRSTPCTGGCCPGSSPPAAWRPSRTRSGTTAPAASTPWSGSDGFDIITELATMLPMRVIGMLLGIPEQDQVAVRERTDANLRTVPGQPMAVTEENVARGDYFADYIEWRSQHPSDDLMTQLLNAGVRGRDRHDADPDPSPRSSPTRRSSPAPATRPPVGSSAGWPSCWPSTPTSAARSSRTAH